MNLSSTALVLAFVPLPYLVATAMLRWLPGIEARESRRIAGAASLLSLLAAGAAAVALVSLGAATSPVIGAGELGPSFRLDVVAVAVSLLIALVGAVVIRFSGAYLDGDPHQRRFLEYLTAALAAVGLLVTAAGLAQLVFAWIAMSLTLHRLLVFRQDRRGARLAARKKFLFARLGDGALVVAALLLAQAFGTLDLAGIGSAARLAADAGTFPASATVAAVLLAVAALLKSAQFPTHGWLLEVMETPTPVSALLHAGIVNAGGFLVLRFSDVLLAAPQALPLLVLVGGATAVIAALAALAQTSIKLTLAWSTVGQMGFMLLQCGLGAFSSALLHLLAHSVYKAHAFLQSGRALQQRRTADDGTPAGPALAALTLAVAVALHVGASETLGLTLADAPAQLALGLVPVVGVWLAWITGPRTLASTALMVPLGGLTVALHAGLQRLFVMLTADTLPLAAAPPDALKVVLGLVVAGFLLAAWTQACAAGGTRGRFAALRVHLANGLYANDLVDRLLGAYRLPPNARS